MKRVLRLLLGCHVLVLLSCDPPMGSQRVDVKWLNNTSEDVVIYSGGFRHYWSKATVPAGSWCVGAPAGEMEIRGKHHAWHYHDFILSRDLARKEGPLSVVTVQIETNGALHYLLPGTSSIQSRLPAQPSGFPHVPRYRLDLSTNSLSAGSQNQPGVGSSKPAALR